MEENAIVIFGKHLKKVREEAGFSLKSFAYQLDLENHEYQQIESGLDLKYMTSLRSDIAPRLLHINDNVEKREMYYKFYRAALELHRELEAEIHKEYIKTLTDNLNRESCIQSDTAFVERVQTEMNSIVNEMEGI